MKYVSYVLLFFVLSFFMCVPAQAQFTTATDDSLVAAEEFVPSQARHLRMFRWEVNGASESVTGYNSSTSDSNYPTGKPIDVSQYSRATIQIAEVTGIGDLMSLSTTPIVQGAVDSATRCYWLEGKIGTTASNVVNYVTLPMREIVADTVAYATYTNGVKWHREGVTAFGVFEADLRGVQTVRVKCGGATVQDASAAIWMGLWRPPS